MKQSKCLHIPTLYEGESAQISWGIADQSTEHIVERVFNESFNEAFSGYTWNNIDTTNEPWNKYEQDSLNWNQFETRHGKGQTWERLDYENLDWSQIDYTSSTWQQLESKDISFEIFRGLGVERTNVEKGRTWLEFDEQNEIWTTFDTVSHTWDEGELVTLPGLSWDSIQARWLNFNDIEQKQLTFNELDTLNHVENHRGMNDSIPIGATSAMYRIKSYDSGGSESGYLTSSQVPVIPIFYRNSSLNYPVQAGKRYLILMKAKDIKDLDRVRMNLCYNSYLLELTNFAAHSQRNILKPGSYPEEQLNIFSNTSGKIWFQSTRLLSPDECFSGALTLLEFFAKESGTATVSLS